MRQAIAVGTYKLGLSVGRWLARTVEWTGVDIRPALRCFEPGFLRLSSLLAPFTAKTAGNRFYLGKNRRTRLQNVGYLLGYEPATTRLFRQLLAPGDIVIDVGAHVGYYTLLAARQVGPAGRVYAFECEPQNYELLVKNIELNSLGWVVPVQKAVSNRVGTGRLTLDRQSGWHSLHLTPDSVGSLLVETTTLDEFLAQTADRHCALLKIDAQGAEAAVLEGAQNLLQENPRLRIILEWWPTGLQAAGVPPNDFFRELQARGFSVSAIVETRGKLVPVQEYVELQELIAREGHTLNLLCEKES